MDVSKRERTQLRRLFTKELKEVEAFVKTELPTPQKNTVMVTAHSRQISLAVTKIICIRSQAEEKHSEPSSQNRLVQHFLIDQIRTANQPPPSMRIASPEIQVQTQQISTQVANHSG
ncbi:hypothetical protein AVEN_33520-1 [Araneus ventricosus]|uniref:Uncharacterized protein n=1 Tax=Araneus ventricosus TaxID=182803 RepID=A0A4Y2GS41_ARAVE|nr:hypothetical protein AVEN_33520-1 [Araneus ventricosus]